MLVFERIRRGEIAFLPRHLGTSDSGRALQTHIGVLKSQVIQDAVGAELPNVPAVSARASGLTVANHTSYTLPRHPTLLRRPFTPIRAFTNPSRSLDQGSDDPLRGRGPLGHARGSSERI